jgi:lipopolysaccharide heptosyltransferase I
VIGTRIQLAREPRRMLLIKPSALGDVVHTLPVLSLLRDRFPSARIDWLVNPAFAGLLEGHPHLDNVVLFERKRLGRAWREPDGIRGIWHLARSLFARRYDLVIDLQGLLRSGWLTLQTRAPMRVGFASAREFAPLCYTHRIAARGNDRHAIERYLDVAGALGCPRGPVRFEFGVRDNDRAVVDQLFDRAAPYAVLLPGTNWLTKRWPAEHFAALVEPLRSRFGLRSVLAGGADAAELASAFSDVVDLTNKTTLRQLVALLERAALVVCNDSGPMHIAAALGVPMVALFGPTSPRRTGPYRRLDSVVRLDIECSPCFSRHCAHRTCLNDLSVAVVLRQIERQLATGSLAGPMR